MWVFCLTHSTSDFYVIKLLYQWKCNYEMDKHSCNYPDSNRKCLFCIDDYIGAKK